jgi:hypothetical protein
MISRRAMPFLWTAEVAQVCDKIDFFPCHLTAVFTQILSNKIPSPVFYF